MRRSGQENFSSFAAFQERGRRLLSLLLAVLLLGCDEKRSGSARLVISGDTGPWIVPCGCTANQSGGLLRRGTYIKIARKMGELVYVDVGGAAAGITPYFREKFIAILRGELQMGIVAHNLGKAELALGSSALREIAQLTSIPFLSANARDAATNALLFPSVKMVTINGNRVAIVGVVSPRFASKDIVVTDPHAAISEVVTQCQGQFDLLIVLAYLPDDELMQMASSTPEANAIIGGPTGQTQEPRLINNLLFASATNKGKYLIELAVPKPQQAWTGKVIELNQTYVDDSDQTGNLKRYLAKLESADFSAQETGLITPLIDPPKGYAIAGDASCVECHKEDVESFGHTLHAKAWQTLGEKGFAAEPYCLQCHTNGYGLPAGFESPRRTPTLGGVGCETCHGPSQAHVKKDTFKTPFNAFDQCVRCHDHENSPKFNRDEYWKKIVHGEKKAVRK